MQRRHTDRKQYFRETAETSENFYLPYINRLKPVTGRERVLEIGCGEGGNLLPFARRGCKVTGVDMDRQRTEQARSFFSGHANAVFTHCDFLEYPLPGSEKDKFDIIILHDVIEHVARKEAFLAHVREFMAQGGVLFVAFPAWQMPFGGHQQICRSRFCSHIPYIHLLPNTAYAWLLKHVGHERADAVRELMSIKECRTSIERFELTARRCRLRIGHRQLWLVNPHYKQKFNLTPRKLPAALSAIRYARNFFSTSCFYLLQLQPSADVENQVSGSRRDAFGTPQACFRRPHGVFIAC